MDGGASRFRPWQTELCHGKARRGSAAAAGEGGDEGEEVLDVDLAVVVEVGAGGGVGEVLEVREEVLDVEVAVAVVVGEGGDGEADGVADGDQEGLVVGSGGRGELGHGEGAGEGAGGEELVVQAV